MAAAAELVQDTLAFLSSSGRRVSGVAAARLVWKTLVEADGAAETTVLPPHGVPVIRRDLAGCQAVSPRCRGKFFFSQSISFSVRRRPFSVQITNSFRILVLYCKRIASSFRILYSSSRKRTSTFCRSFLNRKRMNSRKTRNP